MSALHANRKRSSAGRIIRDRPVETTGKTNELRVVLNWFEMLKTKMVSGQ